MGKFIVTGLHSSGKSAFIISFAQDNDAKLLSIISQLQRSTRFIVEYQFKRNSPLQIDVTFKTRENVENEFIENFKNKLKIEEEVNNHLKDVLSTNGNIDYNVLKQRAEQNILQGKIQEKFEKQYDSIDLIKWIFEKGESNFIKFKEFVFFLLSEEEIKDLINISSLEELTFTSIKNIVGDIYSKCLSKINLINNKNFVSITDNNSSLWSNDSSNQDDKHEIMKENIEMLLCVPDTQYPTKPYFSGIIKHAKVTLGLNPKFLDDNLIPKYGFMMGNDRDVNFTLFDSFGLDHGAKKNDDSQSIILNSYKSIISQPNIDGVLLLGTLSSKILDTQSDEQYEIVQNIINYNLSEKPGLNVIFILNHADVQKFKCGEERNKFIIDRKKEYGEIKHSSIIKQLKNQFQEDYIMHSIDNFLSSICLYSSMNSEERKKLNPAENIEIENMNIETYEKIDKICRSFSRYGISWDDEPDFTMMEKNEVDELVNSLSKYLSSSIKIIFSKKQIDNFDDNDDYKNVSNSYRELIWWNTANALANQWNDKSFYGYYYSGRALNIYNYKDKENFELNQQPKYSFKKHLYAIFNYYCRKNPYYPYNQLPIKNINSVNTNRFIFIQKCMYDAIDEFVERDETNNFIFNRIITLLQKNENIKRYDIEKLNNLSIDNLNESDEIVELFKNIFLDKVKLNFNNFYKIAVDDEIRNRLISLLNNKDGQYDNTTINDLLKAIYSNVRPDSLANLEIDEKLKQRFIELINNSQFESI